MKLSSFSSYRQLRRLSGTAKFRITSVLAIAVVLNKEMAETPALCQKFVIFLQPASIVSIQIGYNLARKDAFQLSLEVIPHLLIAMSTVGSLNGIYGIKPLFPAPTGSATEPTGILLMKLAINATSAEDCFEKKRKVIVYFSSRDP